MHFGKKMNRKPVDIGSFLEVYHSPGYGDMNGQSHSESLKKNKDGKWTISSCDRDSFRDPLVETVYSVSEDAVKSFLIFINQKNILSLTDRKKSDLFVTDYSQWRWDFSFADSAVGKRPELYQLWEYKEYSDADKKLLKELEDRFEGLRGAVISKKKTE